MKKFQKGDLNPSNSLNKNITVWDMFELISEVPQLIIKTIRALYIFASSTIKNAIVATGQLMFYFESIALKITATKYVLENVYWILKHGWELEQTKIIEPASYLGKKMGITQSIIYRTWRKNNKQKTEKLFSIPLEEYNSNKTYKFF